MDERYGFTQKNNTGRLNKQTACVDGWTLFRT